jgi:tetratricopeptide (TPR) repeat protein
VTDPEWLGVSTHGEDRMSADLSGMHAFVVTPFNVKPGADGQEIDFEAIYNELIEPALAEAGCTVVRAKEEIRAGNIRTDMFQELLLADLVVAELTIDNPNVWYELGVRHALRARGMIALQSGRAFMPFDVGPDRTLRYTLKNGRPDPATLENDRAALAAMAKATMMAWHGRKVSPVYQLLPNLKEPDWRSLRVGDINEFWQKLNEWEDRVEVARRRDRPGDILVLAAEMPTRVLRVEALRTAGKALMSLGKFRFALEVFEQALTVEPADLVCRQQKGLALERLERHDEARQWLKAVAADHPENGETLGLIGRTYKDEWVARWRLPDATPEKKRDEALWEEARLREAARAYAAAFRADALDYYPGINAVTLSWLWQELNKENAPELDVEGMIHGVRWAATCRLGREPNDYWAKASLAELEVLTGDKSAVQRAYKAAAAIVNNDWFALNSSKQQLEILQDLGVRPEEVRAAIDVIEREQTSMSRKAQRAEPRRVILFSGHMIDKPEREKPRFPEEMADAAAQVISAELERLEVQEGDLGVCQAACGGDLLFARACLEKTMCLEIRLPQREPEFLANSVSFAKPCWQTLYDQVKAHPNATFLFMPDELGPTPDGVNVYERANLWLLYSALARGVASVHFICLWDGQGGDAAGGTQHMVEQVKRLTGRKPSIIDPANMQARES